MELNRDHRQALLNELQKAKDDLYTQEQCLLNHEEESLINWLEISMFLAQERIKLIEKSLIENEIDF